VHFWAKDRHFKRKNICIWYALKIEKAKRKGMLASLLTL